MHLSRSFLVIRFLCNEEPYKDLDKYLLAGHIPCKQKSFQLIAVIGGILMAIAGILIAISAFVFEEKVCLTVSLVVIVIVSAIALVLSKRIYEEEKKKEQSGNN